MCSVESTGMPRTIYAASTIVYSTRKSSRRRTPLLPLPKLPKFDDPSVGEEAKFQPIEGVI